MEKILTIIGARPQFIKAAAISKMLRDKYSCKCKEIIFHTGQHYDELMSEIFFRQMHIPVPDYKIEAGGLTHGAMTAKMLESIESIMLKEKPALVLLYGDTNSTLAGALSASKLHVPVAHIEAGLRSFNKKMPEEINRLVTDHVSEWLFCPSENARKNLIHEGIDEEKIHVVGDIMLDSVKLFEPLLKRSLDFEGVDDSYLLATVHRQENVADEERLRQIVKALNHLSKNWDVVVPLHPRTKKMINTLNLPISFRLIPPQGYLEMLYLTAHSKLVMTDSGGLQKEAYFFGKKCVTLREETEWIELVEKNYNKLCKTITAGEIARNVDDMLNSPVIVEPGIYGAGKTAEKICNVLLN